jgi:hypothetical protein
MLRYTLLCVAFLGAVGQASASWADGMFDELSRDFGSVPRGQILTHPFVVTNNTGSTVRISNVRVSCGLCTSASALQSILAPGQQTAIVVKLDTRRFYNTKNVTVFVQFDQPRFEEVRLWVQANSRDDVSFTPDNIAFGRIKRGSSPESSVNVTFLGGGQTQITEVKSESNYVLPAIKETRRDGGEVSYELTAKIRPDTPAGKWYTDVWLTTNNSGVPRLRVPITVEVEAALSVSPNTIVLGQVKAGTESDRKVIIRGVKAFRIVGISGTDNELRVRETAADSKTVHVLTVTLSPAQPGELSRSIRVQTDLQNGGDIEFNAQAQVVR